MTAILSMSSGGDDRFEVDSESGIVRTKGGDTLRNVEYELGVSAQDTSAKTLQKSPTHSLKILVGERDPQFFETQYVTSVPESATERYKCVPCDLSSLFANCLFSQCFVLHAENYAAVESC